LVAAHDNRGCAWRAFVTQVSSLAEALEHASLRTPEIISELRSLVQENADLLEAGADRAVFQLAVHVAY
jgi:hypothetical protein